MRNRADCLEKVFTYKRVKFTIKPVFDATGKHIVASVARAIVKKHEIAADCTSWEYRICDSTTLHPHFVTNVKRDVYNKIVEQYENEY